MSDMFDIVEYVDGNETVVFAQSRMSEGTPSYVGVGSKQVEMKRYPNRTGRVPVVIPERISLDKPMGQFDSQIGMFRQEAKLTALSLIAIERNIFPDTYLVGHPNSTPKFVQGPFDGRTGKINVVSGGQIDVKTIQPTQSTEMMADRLERAQRMAGSVPADMTGEAASNVRTGKRGDSIMSATIDMNIQESQEIFAASLEEETKIAIAQAKSYFGNEKKSFYVSGYKGGGDVVYTANDTFENDNAVVTYSYAGTDQNSLVVALAQRKGMGSMSSETVMELDPMITDVPAEKARIDSETIKNLLVQAFTQQASSGAVPLIDLANIAGMIEDEKETLTQAIIKGQKMAQERQATPVAPDAPEAQAGLGAVGQGAEQPTSAPAPQTPPPLLQALSSLTGKPNTTMKTTV